MRTRYFVMVLLNPTGPDSDRPPERRPRAAPIDKPVANLAMSFAQPASHISNAMRRTRPARRLPMRKIVLYTLTSLDGDVDDPSRYFTSSQRPGQPPEFDAVMDENEAKITGT